MTLSDWAIVSATLFGPVLAVQAQKWVELSRERERRKDAIFRTLMATRQSRLSDRHVEALNAIELAFHGTRLPIVGKTWRSRHEFDVLSKWGEYFRHYDRPQPTDPTHRAQEAARADELFVNLLDAMAKERRFDLARDRIKTGSYRPVGLSLAGEHQDRLRYSAMYVFEAIARAIDDLNRRQAQASQQPPAGAPASNQTEGARPANG